MESPRIIMKCPKCQREFSPDANYCEFCSAILEPVEVGQEPGKDRAGKLSVSEVVSVKREKLEDVKIDSLKTDIENKFVFTLMKEIDQLRKRLDKKERLLAEMRGRKTGMDSAWFLSGEKNIQNDIDEISRKVLRLEAILENLRKKIEADISDLYSKVEGVRKPGLLWFLNKHGRYFRMVFSELATKRKLMEIILGKRSPSYFRTVRLVKVSAVVFAIVMFSLAVSWYVFTYSAGAIRHKDIISLLEDVKKANMIRDIRLWESRYSKDYLSAGDKKEKQLEQWRKFDFKSLRYKVSDIKIYPGRASALITWDIELLSRESGKIKTISQQLYADFVKEEGRLKISSVRKKE